MTLTSTSVDDPSESMNSSVLSESVATSYSTSYTTAGFPSSESESESESDSDSDGDQSSPESLAQAVPVKTLDQYCYAHPEWVVLTSFVSLPSVAGLSAVTVRVNTFQARSFFQRLAESYKTNENIQNIKN